VDARFKGSGFIRNLDQLGRIVLPVEWRRRFDLEPGAPLEIIPGGDGCLILRKYVPQGSCTFCGQLDGSRLILGRPVCEKCTACLATAASA